jgi:hypothetical protein
MALLAAPVTAPEQEPRLRVWAPAGLDWYLLRAADGGEKGLGRGLEDLLRIAALPGCAWVARLAGVPESVEYGLSVLGEPGAGGGESAVVVLQSAGSAAAAVVDACDGARHSVLLVQCESERAEEAQALLASGEVGALPGCRLVVLRDAGNAWAVVGLAAGVTAAVLWRVAAPAPAAPLPVVAEPVSRMAAVRSWAAGVVGGSPAPRRPAPAVASGERGAAGLWQRLPRRLTATLAALLIAGVAAGGAGWVVIHRGQGGSAIGPVFWHGAGSAGASPSARVQPMVATSDRSAQAVLFGGADAGPGHGTPLGDTWRGALTPGEAWTPVQTATSPAPRLAGAMASDPADGYVLLFGGEGVGNVGLGDTWSFGGAGWSQLSPHNSPPPGPALSATEPGTGRVLLTTACCTLGAVPTGERMQTWRWSGSDWVLLGPAPGWVTSASMVADGWDGTVVMVASVGGGLGATFIWNGSSWSQHHGVMEPPVAPGTRPRLTYDPRSRSVLDVVTGQDGRHYTYAWSGTAWSEKEAGGGPPVVGAVLPEPVDGHGVLYGGTAEADEYTQRWYWTGSGWAESTRPPAIADTPAAAFGAAVATDPGMGGLMMFGGSDAGDQTWVWTGWAWSQAFSSTPGPPPRQGASLAYDPVGKTAVLVGGRLDSGAEATDVWAWRGNAWRQVDSSSGPPPPSMAAPIAWDRARHQAVLVVPDPAGAINAAQTWTFDGHAWTWQHPATAPVLRMGSSMTFDPATGGILLLVPCCPGTTTHISETWLWDGANWQRLQTLHSPPIRAFVAQDGFHNRTVLVSQCCDGFDSDSIGPPQTWVWDGTDWTRIEATLPALQDVGAVVTDAQGNALLVGRLAGAGPRHPWDGLWRWTGAAWERLV